MDQPESLSGKNKGSFAYKTLANRLPIIITKVIDLLCRQRKHLPIILSVANDELVAAEEETKSLIEELARLKYELQTNKPLRMLSDDLSDATIWNGILENKQKKFQKESSEETSWFTVSWLYAECYFYRRIREIFALSTHYKQFDPFYLNKEDAFFGSLTFAEQLSSRLLTVTATKSTCGEATDLFYFFVMTSLWGNQCDLSISAGEQNDSQLSIQSDYKKLESKIIVNDFSALWNYTKRLAQKIGNKKCRLDIVLDNASFELFTDLCLIEFLHKSEIFPKNKCRVHLHVKKMPWFVSDTLTKDVNWLIEVFEKDASAFSSSSSSSLSSAQSLKKINTQFKQNISNGVWSIEEHDFWTLPHDFSDMSEVAPDLYANLCTSDLIIFKGDLNYRKLVGDLSWKFNTTFKDSLRHFQPTTAICSLRTIKADVVVGLFDEAKIEEIEKSFPENWMETGEFAVIHFLDNTTEISIK